MKTATKSWRHHDIDDVMCRRCRFENTKIGLEVCVFYTCEYQTTQQFVVKFSEIFYA